MANTRSKRAAETTPAEPPKKRATRRAKRAATPEPVERTPVLKHAEPSEPEHQTAPEPEPASEPVSAPLPIPEEQEKVASKSNQIAPEMAVDVPIEEDGAEDIQGTTEELRASDLYLDTVGYRVYSTCSGS